jgi:acylphosphatase
VKREVVVLHGIVQGVGFRYKVDKIARGHAVAGTVCNTPDGAVEIDVEGDDAAVGHFIDEVLARPPRAAHVDRVTREARAPRGARAFTIT